MSEAADGGRMQHALWVVFANRDAEPLTKASALLARHAAVGVQYSCSHTMLEVSYCIFVLWGDTQALQALADEITPWLVQAEAISNFVRDRSILIPSGMRPVCWSLVAYLNNQSHISALLRLLDANGVQPVAYTLRPVELGGRSFLVYQALVRAPLAFARTDLSARLDPLTKGADPALIDYILNAAPP